METSTLNAPVQIQHVNLSEQQQQNNTEVYQTAINSIDNKINKLRKQYLVEWEKNHATSRAPFDDKVDALKIKKNQLKQMYFEAEATGKVLSIDNSMNIKLN